MPNAHNHTSPSHNESSVLFNLQELMRIEQDRVLAEADSERAVQEALQRQRTEHEHRVAEEAARVQRAEAQAQLDAEVARQRSVIESDAARAKALLKVQLEVEASERAERQRLDLAHARALSLIEASQHGRGSGKAIAWLLLGTLMLAALGYFAVLSPLLQDSRAREVEALSLALKHARELSALRERAASQPTPSVQSVVANVDAPDVPAPSSLNVESIKRKGAAHAKVVRHQDARDEIDVLDSDDGDPLIGL